ncbi:MAG: glycosyltransferase family 4 protein [candidate division Zixibacteria bacterium]|nr:glycosyltransferase family 4 protein [candidate division Zixibacteria bacterium]
MRITFVLPGWARFPVGGFKMVYSYANCLVDKGHKVRIVHTLRFDRGNMNIWKKLLRLAFWSKTFLSRKAEPGWFKLSPEVESTVVLDLDDSNIPSADAVIATAWSTAENVNRLSPDKGTKFYFIQGYENWDTEDVKVNATFKLPLKKIVVSIWLEKMLKSMNEEPIACIPNGLDFDFFKIIRPVEDRLPIKIGMCYSIYEWKGSKDGIEALKNVKERFPQLQAIFFSVCSRNSEIPFWIEYRRNPSPSQLVDIYNSCSIFINPSWSEGWGLPAAEAMACGCALISTRNKGAEEFVKDQEIGLLTKVGDPEDMAEKIIKLIENQPLRLKLALTGANFIKKFDLKESAKEFEEAILSNLN